MIGALGKRLAALEARLAPLRPGPTTPAGLEWLEWVGSEDLDWLEQVMGAFEYSGIEPSEGDKLRIISIEADALRRQLAGQPSWLEDGERQRAEREAGAAQVPDERLAASSAA